MFSCFLKKWAFSHPILSYCPVFNNHCDWTVQWMEGRTSIAGQTLKRTIFPVSPLNLNIIKTGILHEYFIQRFLDNWLILKNRLRIRILIICLLERIRILIICLLDADPDLDHLPPRCGSGSIKQEVDWKENIYPSKVWKDPFFHLNFAHRRCSVNAHSGLRIQFFWNRIYKKLSEYF